MRRRSCVPFLAVLTTAVLTTAVLTAGLQPCRAASVSFGLPPGLLPQPQTLTLIAEPPDAEIRITFNGSVPSQASPNSAANGIPYSEPLLIDRTQVIRARAFPKDGLPSPVNTRTFVLASSLLSQATNPPGFPSLWGSVKADYALDQRVVQDPRYRDGFLSNLLQLPWVSLVAPPADLFETNGLYANPLENGTNWERQVSLEILNPANGSPPLQIDAGLQIVGESSRSPEVPKHSLRLGFKSRFGPSKLLYPVFPNSTITEFDTLTLLGGSVDAVPQNFIGSGLAVPLHLRDAFLKQSQIEMGRPGVHTTYAHLFLNGLYWGLYRLSERPDASYASTYFGGRKSDYDVLKHLDFAQLEVVDGDRQAWDAMYAIASQGLEDPARYAAIQSYLDLTAFIDYLIVNMHLGNGDWPQKNWYTLRRRAPGETFRFFCWDGDGVLGLFGITLNKTGFATPNTPAFLYSKLRANPEFRTLFGDRVQALTLGDGPLSVASCQERLQRLAESMQSGIVGESARWGDSYFLRRGKDLFTFDDHWLPELARVLESVIPDRHLRSLEHFRGADLSPRIGPPDPIPASGIVGPDTLLNLSQTNASGTIYYSLNGTDPRLPGGNLSTQAMPYSVAIPITHPASLNARVRTANGWSALITQRVLPWPGPGFTAAETVNGQVRLRFAVRAGSRYELRASEQADSKDWGLVQAFPPQEMDGTLEWIDPRPAGATSTRFYKLIANPGWPSLPPSG